MTSAWKTSWYPNTAGGVGPLHGVDDGTGRVEQSTQREQRQAGDADRGGELRHRRHGDPAQADVDDGVEPLGAALHIRLKIAPVSAPVQTTTRMASASGPWRASRANGVYVPAMSMKIIEWSSRRIQRRAEMELQLTR